MKTICYLSLGYPTIEHSLKMADAYMDGGCDGIEISIPCSNPKFERDTIKGWMLEAFRQVSDYEAYFAAITRLTHKYPGKEFYTMIYHEVVEAVGVKRFIAFLKEAGINCVISANLTPETRAAMREGGVSYCGFGSFAFEPSRIDSCLEPGNAIIYMQAAARPGQQLLPGCETLDAVIRRMRELGITRPIYCGGGISGPEDVRAVKLAGAQGFFVGTAIINYADDLPKLRQMVAEYREAAN